MREFIDLIERMLDELTLIPDFSDDANIVRRELSWGDDLKDAKPVGHIGQYDLLRKYGDDQDIYFLIDDSGNAIGRARVDHLRDDLVTVGHIWFDPNIRGKGYGFEFYKFLLNHGLRIVSDYDHTHYSQQLWKKLALEFTVRSFRTRYFSPVGEPIKDIEPFYGEGKGLLMVSLR